MAATPPIYAPAEHAVIAVWDLPVRIVHWSMAGLIAFSWYSAENHLMDWHRWSGYALLGLLLFRIFWGFFGSSTARFAQFVAGPTHVRTYLSSLPHRRSSTGIGHNPLGALSVLALLLLMAVQVVTGLFAVDIDGIESGPLSDRVSFEQGRQMADVHHASFTVLQILVALHILAILFHLVWKRDNLIGPMMTGKRTMAGTGMKRASLFSLLACSLVAGGMAWAVTSGLHF